MDTNVAKKHSQYAMSGDSTRPTPSLRFEPTPAGLGTVAVTLKVLSDYEDDEHESITDGLNMKESQELMGENTCSIDSDQVSNANFEQTTASFVYETAPGPLFNENDTKDLMEQETIIHQSAIDLPGVDHRGVLWEMNSSAPRQLAMKEMKNATITSPKMGSAESRILPEEKQGMPNYNTMSFVQLQTLADQHGIKETSRVALIEKLQQIWSILHSAKKPVALDYNAAISAFIQKHTELYKKVLRYEVLSGSRSPLILIICTRSSSKIPNYKKSHEGISLNSWTLKGFITPINELCSQRDFPEIA
jgi:hypothetical protein